jgi:hypothetical protein
MSSIYNILSCLNKAQLQLLCATLFEEQKLNPQFLVSKIQANLLNDTQKIQCKVKTLIQRINSEKCILRDIVEFVKSILEEHIISELFSIAMVLKNAMVVPDNIYEKNNLHNIGILDEICELYTIKNLDTESSNFLKTTLQNCKSIISESVDLKKY